MNQLNHDIIIGCTWILLSVIVPNDMMPIEFKKIHTYTIANINKEKKGIKGKTVSNNPIGLKKSLEAYVVTYILFNI